MSILTGIPVRCDVAMTGEITLRGEVLPIGGLKEKLLAAGRGGIKTVLIPEENVKDLAEIPDEIKNRLDIHPVRWIEQVLEQALERHPTPLPRTRTSERRRPPAPARRQDAGAEALTRIAIARVARHARFLLTRRCRHAQPSSRCFNHCARTSRATRMRAARTRELRVFLTLRNRERYKRPALRRATRKQSLRRI